jgi:hypothetical protein
VVTIQQHLQRHLEKLIHVDYCETFRFLSLVGYLVTHSKLQLFSWRTAMSDGVIMIHKVMEHFKVAKSANAGGKKATTQNIKEDNLSKKVDSSMGHLEYEARVLATVITFINLTKKDIPHEQHFLYEIYLYYKKPVFLQQERYYTCHCKLILLSKCKIYCTCLNQWLI